MHRMLTSVGMPRIAAGAEYACRIVNPVRRVALGPEFYGGLEFWCWFVSEGLDALGGDFIGSDVSLARASCSTYIVFGCLETTSGWGGRETGVYWRYDLSVEEQSRFCGSSRSVAGMDNI